MEDRKEGDLEWSRGVEKETGVEREYSIDNSTEDSLDEADRGMIDKEIVIEINAETGKDKVKDVLNDVLEIETASIVNPEIVETVVQTVANDT